MDGADVVDDALFICVEEGCYTEEIRLRLVPESFGGALDTGRFLFRIRSGRSKQG